MSSLRPTKSFRAPEAPRQSGRWFAREPFRIFLSLIWAGTVLGLYYLATQFLTILHDCATPAEFNAYARQHWYRQVAFFWFDSSIIPSVLLPIAICARHALTRHRRAATRGLALFTLFIIAVMAATVLGFVWPPARIISQ